MLEIRTFGVVAATACALVVGLLDVSAANAGPFRITTTANAGVSPGLLDQDEIKGTLTALTDSSVGSEAGGAFVGSFVTVDMLVSAFGFVTAQDGGLSLGVGTSSNNSTTIGEGGSGSSSSGTANVGISVSDLLHVFGGPAAGVLALDFDIAGDLAVSASGFTTFTNGASATATFSANGNVLSRNVGVNQRGDRLTDEVSFPSGWTVFLPYQNGVVNLGLGLNSQAWTHDACFALPRRSSTCTEKAVANLAHTFTLDFIQVLDLAGNLVPEGYVAGESGITYNNRPRTPSVPEPSSIALSTFAIGAAALRRRRAQSASIRALVPPREGGRVRFFGTWR